MNSFFQYKIYRQKFWSSLIVVLLFCTVLFFTARAFFLRNWVREQEFVSNTAFGEMENDLRNLGATVDSYLVRLYSNPPVLQDCLALSASRDMTEYLAARRKNSSDSRDPIFSYPADARRFWRGNTGLITGMKLVNEGLSRCFSLNYNDELTLAFEPVTTSSILSLNETVYYTRALYNPEQVTKKAGEIQFWINGYQLFQRRFSGIGGNYLVLNAQNTLLLSGGNADPEILTQILSDGRTKGAVPSGLFRKTHYTIYASSQIPCRIVYYMDESELMSKHRESLFLLILIFVLLAVAVIGVFLFNNMEDAKFLRRILNTIHDVQSGVFREKREAPARKNEYGMILSALDQMSYSLGEYIRIEYQLKLAQQEATMRALQHQINPHFLYNTLEEIRAGALIAGDRATAESIALLGSLYRQIVRGESVLPFHEELHLLDTYLRIMGMRYQGHFCYQLEVEPSMQAQRTVKFWLQPIAENFFSHGFHPDSEYNLLLVHGWREGEYYRLDIVDNGRGIPADRLPTLNRELLEGEETKSTSIGLRNVYQRLSYFYGTGFSMEVKQDESGGTCVALVLPDKPA